MDLRRTHEPPTKKINVNVHFVNKSSSRRKYLQFISDLIITFNLTGITGVLEQSRNQNLH
jgi:hypothetical protein